MSTDTLDLAWAIQAPVAPVETSGTLSLAWVVEPPVGSGSSNTLDLEWTIYDSSATTQGVLDLAWSLAEQETIVLELDNAPSGLAGSITITITTLAGVTVLGPTATGIVETPIGTGRYLATVVAPPFGTYYVYWSNGTETTPLVLLTITAAGAVTFLPVPPGRINADLLPV